VRVRALALVVAVLSSAAACRVTVNRGAPSGPGGSEADTVAARRAFLDNIDAIHKRDRPRYLRSYLQTPTLARNGPGGLELGWEGWSARRDSTWPDTLVATDVRVVPVAPGVVYGSYRSRVTQRGATTSGVSERVLVRTPDGWRIAVTTAFPVVPPNDPPR
jgi:hypothetical protein